MCGPGVELPPVFEESREDGGEGPLNDYVSSDVGRNDCRVSGGHYVCPVLRLDCGGDFQEREGEPSSQTLRDMRDL